MEKVHTSFHFNPKAILVGHRIEETAVVKIP